MTLHERYQEKKDDFEALNIIVPSYIPINLKQNMRAYQTDALLNFLYWDTKEKKRLAENHVLFQMATGSGKTMLMAALMLYLYHKGYRKFLFFVNSTTILEKTKDNFSQETNNKYLFAPNIEIEGTRVQVRVINSFDEADDININILFTTIQGLHTTLNTQRENSPIYEDFTTHNIVLLADEAHHYNKQTKQRELALEASWENTIQTIFAANPHNYLIELTATANLERDLLRNKYENKLLYNYPLHQFKKDGFSKQIRIIDTTIEKKWRILLALVVSEYKRYVAGLHNLQIKPVVLFKSNTIAISEENHAITNALVEEISIADFDELERMLAHQTKSEFLLHITRFISEQKNFLLHNFTISFHRDRCINVNNDAEKQKLQKLLNSLEDPQNNIRVIFAVDKLNEGWDVLNLFDIVKLYEVKNIKNTSVSEVQLIGRGARYFPFVLDATDTDEEYTRKFDLQMDEYANPNVLEQLHYHALQEVEFIKELNRQLALAGLTEEAMKEVKVELLPLFAKSDFYKTGYIYTNQKQKVEKKMYSKNSSIFDEDVIPLPSEHIIYDISKTIKEHDIATDIDRNEIKIPHTVTIQELETRIFYKALHSDSFFSISSIRKYIDSNMQTAKDLQKLFENCTITFYLSEPNEAISNIDKYLATCKLLKEIQHLFDINIESFKGTRTFTSKPIKDVLKNIKISITNDIPEDHVMRETSNIPYFAQSSFYGDSSYETRIIHDLGIYFFDRSRKDVYSDVWVFRNYGQVKLYNFADGKGFQPDFLLFFKKYKKNVIYQVFLEPKGAHIAEYDRWKETFLQNLCQIDNPNGIHLDTEHYRLVGVPFYAPETGFTPIKEKIERIGQDG